MSKKSRVLLVGGALALAGLIGWFFWGPVLGFCFSLIPETAKNGWVGKIACTGGVGYFGGIIFPLIPLGFAFFAALTD